MASLHHQVGSRLDLISEKREPEAARRLVRSPCVRLVLRNVAFRSVLRAFQIPETGEDARCAVHLQCIARCNWQLRYLLLLVAAFFIRPAASLLLALAGLLARN